MGTCRLMNFLSRVCNRGSLLPSDPEKHQLSSCPAVSDVPKGSVWRLLGEVGLGHVDKHQLSGKVCPAPLSSAGFLSVACVGKTGGF